MLIIILTMSNNNVAKAHNQTTPIMIKTTTMSITKNAQYILGESCLSCARPRHIITTIATKVVTKICRSILLLLFLASASIFCFSRRYPVVLNPFCEMAVSVSILCIMLCITE